LSLGTLGTQREHLFQPSLQITNELLTAVIQTMPATRVQLQLLRLSCLPEQRFGTRWRQHLIILSVCEQDRTRTDSRHITGAITLWTQGRHCDYRITLNGGVCYNRAAE
jgi:hypothetical protein